MKHCPRCDQDLPLTSFYVNRRKKDGRDWRCKDCKRIGQNREEKRRRDRAYHALNKNKNLARLRAREFYSIEKLSCAVMNCSKMADELHHVTYEDALAVVPLCREHHRLDHDTCSR